MSLKEFREEVRKTYTELTFSGVDLQVSGIKTRPIHFGYAFASFDNATYDRWLYINEVRLFQRYQTALRDIRAGVPADTVAQLRRLRETTFDEVRGLMAHEWAHHFLGHTFGAITRINERNADFLAGRILFEFYNENNPTTRIDSAQLRRSLAVTNLFSAGSKGTYHLPSEARTVLIQKGFTTAWLLRRIQELPTDPTIVNQLNNLELAGKINELENNYKVKKDTLVLKISRLKMEIDSMFKGLDSTMYCLEDSVGRLEVVSQDGTPISPMPIDSLVVMEIEKKSTMHFQFQMEVIELDYNYLRELDLLKKKIPKTKINTPDDQFEPLYNFFYINMHRQKNIKNINEDLLKSVLNTFKNPSDENKVCFLPIWFCLKGEVAFNILINENQVEVWEATVSRKVVLNFTSLTDLNLGFKYTFHHDRTAYFLDENLNLWTETLGAPFLSNKIFLQKYSQQ